MSYGNVYGRRQAAVRSVGVGAIVGMGVLTLGAGMFALGLFHGFANGSCSSTGYSGNWGPVPRCASGIGWWMGMVILGVFVSIVGAGLSGTMVSVLAPALFIAIGAPFLALALRGGDAKLAYGASASTGHLEVGIFGGAFLVAGLTWGGFALARSASARAQIGVPGLLASAVGIAAAFGLASLITGAIGTAPPPSVGQPSTSSAAATAAEARAAKQTQQAINQATRQTRQATRLAACVTAAGASTHKIMVCERKYTP
jgi:hypothetical protein